MGTISGIKLINGSASVSRCEDIGANHQLHWNGPPKPWMESQEEIKIHLNNS